MRLLIIALLVAVGLTGCSAGTREPVSGAPTPAPGVVSADPSAGSYPPADDPSAVRKDARGRTPDAAVTELIVALNSRDWTTAYSLYATPTVDFEVAAQEWAQADERYTVFAAQEARVADAENASVRITYTVMTTPPGGSPYTVTVSEPGEWWPVHKVDGVWKVGWMPRQ